jgi:L-iditol 2-dehydrogenase
LIIGPGTIGLLAAQVALSCGAQVIVGGLARHTARFALARRLGIAHTLDLEDAQQIENLRDLTHGLGPHRIIECSGSLSAAQSALQMVRKTGSLVFVGYFYQNVALDFDLLINKEVSQIGSRGKRHSTWPMVLDLLARGQVDTETLITHRFPLDNWETAFTRAKQSGAKVLLEINSVV